MVDEYIYQRIYSSNYAHTVSFLCCFGAYVDPLQVIFYLYPEV